MVGQVNTGAIIVEAMDSFDLALLKDGTTLVVPCLAVVLYASKRDTAGIQAFYDRALEVLGPRLTHGVVGGNLPLRKISVRTLERVPTWMRQPESDAYHEIELYGASENEGASASSLYLFDVPHPLGKFTLKHPQQRFQRALEFYQKQGFSRETITALRLSLPLGHEFEVSPADFVQWIVDQPILRSGHFAGYASYAFNFVEKESLFNNGMEATLPLIQEHLRGRLELYPALDFFVKSDVLRYGHRPNEALGFSVPMIKRVYWLTLLSSETLSALGGAEQTTARFTHERIHVHGLSSGLAVQVGDAPVMDLRAERPLLSAYRHVAAVVRKVRFESIDCDALGFQGDPMVQDASTRWLDFFDAA